MKSRREDASGMMAVLAVFGTIALVGCDPVAPPAKRPTSASPRAVELAASIDALAEQVISKTPAAGLSIAVVWHGETVVAKGYGFADVERRTPATANTIYRIGSITKQFAAASILQLAAAHELSLDDDLTKYVPDYPTHGHAITIRELLGHTSGIRDYEHGVPWFAEHMAEQRPPAELVAKFAAEPLDFEPGTHWSYSNSGYFLLGMIVERVANQPFPDYVRDHVLAPAGITAIQYCPDDQDYPAAAKPYVIDHGVRAAAPPIKMVYAYAAGGLCATAPALVAWSAALAHGRVVGDAWWKMMTTPGVLSDGSHTSYGLGLFVGDLGGHRAIFHGGGINGFVSTLAYYPDDDLYIAVLVDTEGSFADDLGESIARTALRAPRPAITDRAVTDDEAGVIAGRYEVIGMSAVFVIEASGGAAYARMDGSTERKKLLRQDDGSYVVDGAETRLVFDHESSRAVKLRLIQAGVTFEARRTP